LEPKFLDTLRSFVKVLNSRFEAALRAQPEVDNDRRSDNKKPRRLDWEVRIRHA